MSLSKDALSYWWISSMANISDSKNTESLIKNLGKGDGADYSGCRECSICLGSVLVRSFRLVLVRI